MGGESSKKLIIDYLGLDRTCPLCDKFFPGNTPIQLINDHMIMCAQQPSSSLSSEEETETCGGGISFEDKVKLLTDYLNEKRISWPVGGKMIKIVRETALENSMSEMTKLDLYEELKIIFSGEEAFDAGGLIREWFMVLLEELESKEMKLFEKADCEEYSLLPYHLLEMNDLNKNYFRFIGELITKGLIDGVPINLCFNKIIYKMLVDEPITGTDMKFVDKQLYCSLMNLLNLGFENIGKCGLYYVYEYFDEQGILITHELIPNGAKIPVIDIYDYLDKRIHFLLNLYEPFIAIIKQTINKYISNDLIKMFNSYELELLICGKPYIDIVEWINHTEYKGKYSKEHKVIVWFWECLSRRSQEDLRRFFQFCTGSSRVPINGFSTFVSYQGEIRPFCIESVPYRKKGINVIRAHICFYTIDLPLFKTEQEVDNAITTVLDNAVVGFGMA